MTETHATAASFGVCALCVFNGDLYVGTTSLAAAGSTILKRTLASGAGSWSTVKTSAGTAAKNAFTSLWVFNNTIFAGWTSGDGSAAALILSSTDGTTWGTDKTLNTTEVVCQAMTFMGNLYVVLGKTGASYNTATRIMQRTTAGVWTEVDNPSDKFAGCIGVVYA